MALRSDQFKLLVVTGMMPDSCVALQLPRLSSCGGFSFIEVMIVVVILAILATLLIPRVMGRTEDAKRAAAKAQISNIESALQLYKLDNGNIPTTEQGLKALVERPVIRSCRPQLESWRVSSQSAGRSLERFHTSTPLLPRRVASSKSSPSGPTGSREAKGKTPTS
jgi:prepilin-type N-terminal cleavage/methylation domain-containing protein